MKTSSIIVLLLVSLMSFSFSSVDRICPVEEEELCGAVILSGCVGACGVAFKDDIEAPVTGLYCFEATSSLCPTNGTLTVVRRNGVTLFTGDASGGFSFFFPAVAGDKIQMGAELTDKKSDVVCVWLGEVNHTIRRP